MASGFEITCANRRADGTIVRIGGQGWSLSVQEAIIKIVIGQLRLNLLLDNTFVAVGVRGDGSNAYLALEPDGRPLSAVDGLPSC